MIRYNLLKQGYGAIEAFDSVMADDEVAFSFTDDVEAEEPLTVKLVGSNAYFAKLKNGKCSFPKTAFKGKIGVCVISPSGTIPCTGLIAFPGNAGEVNIVPDVTDVLARLGKSERDVSMLIQRYNDLVEKYDDLYQRIIKLFEGYNI